MTKAIARLVVVVVSYCFGLYFYSKGFLLTRRTLELNSSCADVQFPRSDGSDNCWMQPRFRRAIFLVVDALRYDFVEWQSTVQPANRHFHNQLPAVRRLLVERPHNALLYRFVADAPTTTLQRLKALTTGSLPTFVDAGSNFAGTALTEDNLVAQLNARRRPVVALGDDTWAALFPRQFARQHMFPSFDVQDLHTVDDGVGAHLGGELARDDWALLVAHVLGVDHCGHKYGPNHPQMAAKLAQMDSMIRQTTEAMDADTVLFVLGDHGMTRTGDHGGDSADEVSAALFVYSPAPLHQADQVERSISQLDLIPTVSLLLDIPIPFCNLGFVIPEVFPDAVERRRAARATVWQVVRYAESYSRLSGDFSLKAKLQPVLRVFNSLDDAELTTERCAETTRRIQSIFRDVWATFHIGWMTVGLLCLLETFLWSVRLVVHEERVDTGRRRLMRALAAALSLLALVAENEAVPPALVALLAVQVAIDLNGLRAAALHTTAAVSPRSALAAALLLLNAAGRLSNSFVVFEDAVCRYCAQAALLLCFLGHVRHPASKAKSSSFRAVVRAALDVRATGALVCCVLVVRLGANFNRCREEQGVCTDSSLTLPLASFSESDSRTAARLLIAVIPLCTAVVISQWLLRKGAHLTGAGVKCLLLNQGSNLCALAIILHWLLSAWLPERFHSQYAAWTNALPLFVYGSLFSYIGVFCWSPLLTAAEQPSNTLRQIAANHERDARRAYAQLASNWSSILGRDKPRIDGHPTVVCGSLAGLFVYFYLFLAVLLGDGLQMSLFVYAVALLLCLRCVSGSGADLLVLGAATTLLAQHSFYALGHQATFTVIPWEAAFVGVPGSLGLQPVQAALVVLHLGAGQGLAAVCTPLLAVWSLTSARYAHAGASEAELLHDGRLDGRLHRVSLTLLSCAAVNVIFVALASAIHRRHLMVWKIFAPRFMFECCLFLVFAIFLLLANAAVYRICRPKMKL